MHLGMQKIASDFTWNGSLLTLAQDERLTRQSSYLISNRRPPRDPLSAHSLIQSGSFQATSASRKTLRRKGKNFRVGYSAKTGIGEEVHFGSTRISLPLAMACSVSRRQQPDSMAPVHERACRVDVATRDRTRHMDPYLSSPADQVPVALVVLGIEHYTVVRF